MPCTPGPAGPSGIDPVIDHLTDHGLHQPEWRNVNMLVLSMLRGRRAGAVLEHVLDADSAYEQWLHRDLLLVGEAMGESPALVLSIDDEFATRVVDSMVDLCLVNRVEIGFHTSGAVRRVLRSWRDTPLIDTVRRALQRTDRQAFPVERHCVQALIGDTESACDALVALIVSGDEHIAELAAMAMRNLGLDLDLACGRSQIDDLLASIPGRVAVQVERGVDERMPYTVGELVGHFGRNSPIRDEVRAVFLSWLNDRTASACLRGVAATGLGYLRETPTRSGEASSRCSSTTTSRGESGHGRRTRSTAWAAGRLRQSRRC